MQARTCEVCDREIRRGGTSYTYDTLAALQSDDKKLFLLCGTDMVLSFDRWYRYEDILSMATLCVATRENEVSVDALSDYAETKLGLSEGEYVLSEMSPMVCSSTEVRNMVKKGSDLSAVISNWCRKNNLLLSCFS